MPRSCSAARRCVPPYPATSVAAKRQTDDYIKQAAGITSASKLPGREVAGKIKRSQLREIAEKKMKDLNANDLDAATKIIEGSARAMGLEVVEG